MRHRGTRRRRFIPWPPVPPACPVCGKRRYATREAAEMVIERASERRREQRAYRAHGWWHLTSREDYEKEGN